MGEGDGSRMISRNSVRTVLSGKVSLASTSNAKAATCREARSCEPIHDQATISSLLWRHGDHYFLASDCCLNMIIAQPASRSNSPDLVRAMMFLAHSPARWKKRLAALRTRIESRTVAITTIREARLQCARSVLSEGVHVWSSAVHKTAHSVRVFSPLRSRWPNVPSSSPLRVSRSPITRRAAP